MLSTYIFSTINTLINSVKDYFSNKKQYSSNSNNESITIKIER